MADKIAHNLTDEIAETLFITVKMREMDAMSQQPIMNDQVSVELVNNIDYPFAKFSQGSKMSAIGVPVRGKYIDAQTAEFISSHATPIVVCLGCGLDARQRRLPNASKAIFYQLDLPQVIALREKFFTAERYLRTSLFEEHWMVELRDKHPHGQFIFVIEGVLMYFPVAQVKDFLLKLQHHFHGGQVIFDAISSYLSTRSKQHDTLRKMRATYKWGVKTSHDIAQWSPQFKVLEVYYIMVGMRPYSFLVRLVSYIPLFKKSSLIIKLALGDEV